MPPKVDGMMGNPQPADCERSTLEQDFSGADDGIRTRDPHPGKKGDANRPYSPPSPVRWSPVRPFVRLARPVRPFVYRSTIAVATKEAPRQRAQGYDGGMDRITINSRQMGGVPCIRGSRIPVATVVGMIADGMTPDEIVAELPPLELDDISAALRFAADAVADREIPLQTTA